MKKLILAGGGHVHVHLISNAKKLKDLGLEITVIQKSNRHYYSGMGPGILSDNYTEDEISFSVDALSKKNGVNFIKGEVIKINPKTQTLKIKIDDKEEDIPYDILSCNLGSESLFINGMTRKDHEKNIYVSKPIENLLKGKRKLDELIKKDDPIKVLVIGGGPASLEIAGNISSYLKTKNKDFDITLFSKEVLKGFPEKVKGYAKAVLKLHGIKHKKYNIKSIKSNNFIIDNGDTENFDIAFVNIGVKSNAVFKNSGLRVSSDDSLTVNHFLQSVDYENIFAAGDCINIQNEELARVGVHAVRESALLLDNIERYIKGQPLKMYKVDNDFLMIINTGGGKAIFVKRGFIFLGRIAYKIKDFIDRRFMNKYY